MPLSFESKNYGKVAFGFFNIETDMLLLENYFFFADQFCEWMGDLALEKNIMSVKCEPQVYVIENPDDIGDLMGAIHGMRFTGFIGRLYEIFPFPRNPEAFRQNPEGMKTQKIVTENIQPFAVSSRMPIIFFRDTTVQIGRYGFELKVFHDLIRYVYRGGYPRWKNDIRPLYVTDMVEKMKTAENLFFQGVIGGGDGTP